MATNSPKGSGRRGEVRQRSQFFNTSTKTFTKRNTDNGQFMDNKTSGGKFKGVRTEK